jgi:hypothetical protein
MTNSARLNVIRLLAFTVPVLVLAESSGAQTLPPAAEQMAKTYGLDSWSKIEKIRYSFNLESGEVKFARSWEWEPKTDQISYQGKGKDGKPVMVTYQRSQLGRQSDAVQNEIDPAFVNDQYWLLFPLHVSWDSSNAKVTDEAMHELPLGKGSAERIVVKYSSDGGYAPGDTWELYVGTDHRIEELLYRGGGPGTQKRPKLLMATWADHKKAGPLLVSTDHRGTADGKSLRVFFSDVSVKVTGSDTWVNAQ